MKISLKDEIKEMREQESKLEESEIMDDVVEETEEAGMGEGEEVHYLENQDEVPTENEVEEKDPETMQTITQVASSVELPHTISAATKDELLNELHMREAKERASEELKKREIVFVLEEEEKELLEKLHAVRSQIRATLNKSDDTSKRRKSKGFHGKSATTLILENLTEEVCKPTDIIEKIKSEFDGPLNSLTTIVNQTLAKLISQGQVVKESRGLYRKA